MAKAFAVKTTQEHNTRETVQGQIVDCCRLRAQNANLWKQTECQPERHRGHRGGKGEKKKEGKCAEVKIK